MLAILNSRELALLVWLSPIVVFLFMRSAVLSSLVDLTRLAISPKVSILVLAMFGYIAALVMAASSAGLWTTELAKGTVLWVVGPAVVLRFSLHDAVREPRFLQRAVLRTAGWSAFVGFWVNLRVFSFPVELVLQPTLALLAVMSAVSELDERLRSAARVFEALLSVVGLAVFVVATKSVVSEWDEIDQIEFIRALVLPAWLTIAVVPFMFAMALYMAYDTAFIHINVASPRFLARLRAKVVLTLLLHVRLRAVSSFAGYWPRELTSAPSLREARRVVREFQSQRRGRENTAKAAADRLTRFSGVGGADADGRRLDEREFEETREALRLLATAQMGWYRNRDERYRPELVNVLQSQFERVGLPQDHGVKLQVSDDGQSWWGWRRTVSGWCFAIGAVDPSPDQWLFDGPESPLGFPGESEDWGSRWGVDAANW